MSLKKEAESLIIMRNRLVHGQVMGHPVAKVGRRFCLRTPIFAVMPALKGKIVEYYLPDLENMRKRMYELNRKLEALGFTLLKASKGRLPKGVKLADQLRKIDLSMTDFEALKADLAGRNAK